MRNATLRKDLIYFNRNFKFLIIHSYTITKKLLTIFTLSPLSPKLTNSENSENGENVRFVLFFGIIFSKILFLNKISL